jgi:hypothetical protein
MNNNICPICFNEFDYDICGNYINVVITKCNHIFCLPCIIRHSKRKKNCPLCRAEFLEENDIENDLLVRYNNIIYNELLLNYTENIPQINVVYDISNITFSMRYENNYLNTINSDISNNILHNHRLITNYDEVITLDSSSNSDEDSEDLFENDSNEIL